MHDDHQGVRGQALEVLVDGLASGDRLRSRGLPACARQRRLDLRGEDAEHDGHERPRDRDRAEMGGGVAAQSPDRSIRGGHRETSLRYRAERRPNSRPRIKDAGHAPTSTYSHWLMPTNAVSSRNQGDTTAASSALSSVTVAASAKSTRSSGQPLERMQRAADVTALIAMLRLAAGCRARTFAGE